MLAAIRRSLTLIEPDRRKVWIGLVGLAFVASSLDALGALLVFAVLGLVASSEGAADLPLIGDLRDRFPGTPEDRLLVILAVIVAAVVVVRAVAFVSQTYLQARVAHNAGVRLSAQLLDGYLRMPWSAFVRRNTAELVRNALLTVSEVTTGVFIPTAIIASELLLVIAIATVLFLAAPLASALAVALVGVAIVVLVRTVHPRLTVLGDRYQAELVTSQQTLQESLGGLRDIRVLGRERWFGWVFARSRARLAETQYLRATYSELPRLALEVVVILFVLGFVVITATGDDGDTIAVLGMFGYAAMRLLPSVNKIVVNLGYLRFATSAVEQLRAELDLIAGYPRRAQGDDAIAFEHELRVEGVTYRYEGTDTDALSGVDVAIRKGESIGIVGPTGGGKSTLIDIMLGLLTPTSGVVTIDGADLRGCESAWHRHIGMVPQAVFLADTSLRRNIALGTDDEEIDDARVAEAVAAAQLEDFVASLPDGLDTEVGDRGVRLSGGQRQRIAIARALYRKPDVLVFDEGTSALDALTESEVVRALAALRGSHTLVTVAHRLTTVQRCDRVLLVRNGAIAASGTYDALLAESAEFRQLAAQPC